MTEFFVIMQKRDDGKVYADLRKSCEKIYLTKEEAEFDYDKETAPFRNSFHIVRLFACTEEEMAGIGDRVAFSNEVFRKVLELIKA